MMDLHVHTYYSDGIYSPTEVVKRAKANRVSLIAITDHDGTDGIEEALMAGKKYNVKVIPGIEISVSNKGGNMHILGYEIDIYNQDFKRAVETMRKHRADRNEAFYKAFAELGIIITPEEIKEFAFADYIGKPQFARVLLKRGLISNTREAFDGEKFFKAEVLRKVPRIKPSPEEGIGIILAAGGIPVLAHPSTLNLDADQLGLKLAELKGYGLMGIECYYSKHEPAETAGYKALANQYQLKITAGSDFHGDILEDPNRTVQIGSGIKSNLNISEKEYPF
jgi:predicted metal-dependent phosphoesterase TrpH